ncbi:MAG: D-2-hydroxyacid dehydrogenase, partial [Rhizobiales bacterium]|nr:D-2-hydroxyacid dehydrogenase [Hyphomicrobiales bacterium]
EPILAAKRLRFVQVCAAGYDQFDLAAIEAAGIRMANASGVNKNAVSEHAMALILALTRQIHIARDNQRNHHWRGMISEFARREDELPGKTMLIFGVGQIGQRTAKLAKAFDMTVIGIRRDISEPLAAVDELYGPADFPSLIPRADVVVLCCPLTPQTTHLMNAATLAAMKPSAYLVNVARGACVDETALIAALDAGAIAGAGIDTTGAEPLAGDSALWSLENVVLTPHTGGETRKYEDNVIDILLDNVDRLTGGETALRNQIV